jgi:sec-independent protein translocase protein TatA
MSTALFAFGFPGGMELIVVLIIMLILFGHRLPSVMRSLGASAREFKKGAEGIGEDIEEASKASPKDSPSKTLSD